MRHRQDSWLQGCCFTRVRPHQLSQAWVNSSTVGVDTSSECLFPCLPAAVVASAAAIQEDLVTVDTQSSRYLMTSH